MMKLLLSLLGLLCSTQLFSQDSKNFYVECSDAGTIAEIELWVSNKGYKVSRNKSTADYTISCMEIKRSSLRRNLVFISILDNKDVVVGQTKTVYAYNKKKSYVLLAELELDGIIKKAIAKEDSNTFRAVFSDTLLTIVRSKTEVVTTRSTVSFTGKKSNEIKYYFEFENNPVKAKFKDYHGNIYNGKLPDSKMIEVNILPDTTIKETMTYKVQLYYKLKDDSDFKKDKLFTIKVLAQEAVTPIPFHKNELILFAGTTYDHYNPGNKISGLSIEPMFTTQASKYVWLRFGVFIHPNFTRDSSNSFTRNYYYRLKNEELVNNKTTIGRYSTSQSYASKIQSIGFYTDLIFTDPKSTLEKGVRISPFIHVEIVKRIITPTSVFSSSRTDTLFYNTDLIKDPKYVNLSRPDTSLNVLRRYTRDQLFLSVGWITEISLKDAYIFFQPMSGIRAQFVGQYVPGLPKKEVKLTLGYKFAIRYKELISLAIDHRDFLSRDEYLNISIGVPTTIAKFTKK
ncbi:hypothetical protein [Dyadobacter sediminis]|uniref:Uncharacterized protein n=1 Tax=Dyadobacter sediminis TaxID=1493691 RepID=A0A5R9K8D8_9BACT|nr:hypothetical protein [Dyadobacter sediminis]TLU90295.1 hypothetical protein FEM55_17150 [Dyadobacter sediminis]GGC06635.1 hypothetical protein GCM10011325_36820 [Dyadobacter sediminis]